MSTTISKTTYTFTVLHRTDDAPLTMEDAINDAESGHAVGRVIGQSVVELPDNEVPRALRKLGNDGTFFDDDLDTSGDPDEPLFVITRQQVEDHAERPLTEEEAALFARTFIHTSVGACIDGWLEGLDPHDDDGNRITPAGGE